MKKLDVIEQKIIRNQLILFRVVDGDGIILKSLTTILRKKLDFWA